VAVEADWPDAYRVNRYVRGVGTDCDVTEALGDFTRFPQWMWRNADVLDFVGWLREHNEAPRGRSRGSAAGPGPVTPASTTSAATSGTTPAPPGWASRNRASARWWASCWSSAAPPASTRAATAAWRPTSCSSSSRTPGWSYYRSMFRGRAASWNLRDRHMVETLDALVEHLRAQRRRAVKVVVWAHNSHLGDARATELGRRGELNVGQLVREGYDDDAVLVGFTTYSGTVTAAADWDEPAERKTVKPALPDSYEAAFHAVGVGNFTLDLRGRNEATAVLAAPRLERAIGVIYRPETERQSHYFEAVLPRQFDVLLHYDHTRAVEPLERTPIWERGEGCRRRSGMLTAERIRGQLVDIEIGEVSGIGWVAVGTVRQGLSHEIGMRFEARAQEPAEAERRLKMDIESAFA